MNKLISNLKYDIPAGIVVFLVALPLCLGIALASGAPLLSGLISGILGGIVVGFLSGSSVSVSGPAAGLAAIVLSSISQLESFEVFLVAVIIAGLLQLIAGIFKLGYISDAFPSNVIKGLLAAIGIILIIKQVPYALGYNIDNQANFLFLDEDGKGMFTSLFSVFHYVNPGAITIAFSSLIILSFWDKTPLKKIKFFPASLFVVIFGVILNGFFMKFIPHLALPSLFLVALPEVEASTFLTYFEVPKLNVLLNADVWVVGITIAIVASLETLLNIEATDNLDPHRRHTPPNKELVAQGIGNMVSGLLGGLPLTSVVVRSSVNINANAKSKVSTILHGFFLLLSVFLLAPIINLIPLSSLAAILIVTGYKLAKISLFKAMFQKGLNQFIPFIITVIAIIFTDLLIGVLIGLTISAFYLLKYNYLNPYLYQKEKLSYGETIRLELPSQATFLNKAPIKNALWNIPDKSNLIIDASYSTFIDHDIRELIDDFKTTVAPERKIRLNILGVKVKKKEGIDYIQFTNILDQETQTKISPKEIIQLLKEGNKRFVKGKLMKKYFKKQITATAEGQYPMAVVLHCIDSRTSAERIFDTGIGDLFCVRVAGNVVNEDILGSMEYACKVSKSKVILILGHTSCGAIGSACANVEMGNITALLQKIKPAVEVTKKEYGENTEINASFINQVAKNNVVYTMSKVLEQSPIIKDLILSEKVIIVGGMYDIKTGKVEFFDEKAMLV